MIYILPKIAAVRAKLTSRATVQPAPTDSIRAFSTATNISELQDLGAMEKPQKMAVTRIETLGSNAALQSRLWTASASKLTPRSPSLTIQQMPSYSNRRHPLPEYDVYKTVQLFGAWKRTDSQRDPNDTLELQAETVGPAE